MASTAAQIRRSETTQVPTEAQDPALAQLGSTMRIAESADRAVDAPAAVVAPPEYARRSAAPLRGTSTLPAVCACPRCYSPDMAPSRRQTIPVKLLGLFGIARFRCHACGKRSWWF
jgi:hypothetical protein